MDRVFVDMNHLTFCWQDDNPQAIYYLDKDTGSIILLGDPNDDDDDEDDDVRTEIELEPSRFLFVPKQERKHTELDLSDFLNTIADETIKGALSMALEQQDKLFAARAVFKNYPAEQARWDKFRTDAARSRVKRWLAINGVEPMD